MFVSGANYTKKDIYRILDVPQEKQGGNWDTGYNRYNSNFYLFCNIGVAGRTGHDYENRWIDNNLIWYAKSKTTVFQPLVKDLLSNNFKIFIFTRKNDKDPFTFAGIGIVYRYKNSTPVEIVFTFKHDQVDSYEINPEEISAVDKNLWEGSSQKILVNKYERNPQARKECIAHFGFLCQVCEFDFEKEYGIAGKDFIHIHHLTPISQIKKGYIIDPKKDLIPVCPNCHAIIHKRNPCFTILEVKAMKVNLKINISE